MRSHTQQTYARTVNSESFVPSTSDKLSAKSWPMYSTTVVQWCAFGWTRAHTIPNMYLANKEQRESRPPISRMLVMNINHFAAVSLEIVAFQKRLGIPS